MSEGEGIKMWQRLKRISARDETTSVMGPGETFAAAIKPTFQLGEMDGETKLKEKPFVYHQFMRKRCLHTIWRSGPKK